MSTNKGFFKFQNVQIVRRPTHQNTQLNIQGTAEDQFQDSVAAAEQEPFQDIVEDIVDDLLEDSDGPDVVQTRTQVSITSFESDTSSYNVNSLEAPVNTSELTSALTSSIEIIALHEVQQEPPQQPESSEATQIVAQVPVGPALQLPSSAIPPVNLQTNVATFYDNDVFTEDEDDDQTVLTSLNNPCRTETLPPTPNAVNTIQSTIELTVKNLQPCDEPLIVKCGEVDLLLSTNATGPHHDIQLREELVMLIPILYQAAFNIEGFPSLENWLWKTVGMLKCYLSVTKYPADHQFQDIVYIYQIMILIELQAQILIVFQVQI